MGSAARRAPHEVPGAAPVRRTTELLAHLYPTARTELDHDGPAQLLIATVLSTQTTDARVNSVTPQLFSRWPDLPALAAADPQQVEEVLRPLGMGPTRARRVIALAAALLERHGGQVPDDETALVALPGVGRKTSHVVRGVAFGRSLLAVDTHVGRLARRFGWSTATDPRRVEDDVVARVEAVTGPEADGAIDLTLLSLRLILHGRRVCTARSPRCAECALREVCPSADLAGTGMTA
ncbi:endonuclease III [Brachybacterium sp. EF45031]|uniref:endonuclease III domain-containing protein n=1 Tax=Brachybacterium sillae TaxID=2810536 RepID=UPI00217E9043|nr:endonuclease III [Brachybacterium sillae]MCS6712133.1 endonuclease III [Brachybacterium sillae]